MNQGRINTTYRGWIAIPIAISLLLGSCADSSIRPEPMTQTMHVAKPHGEQRQAQNSLTGASTGREQLSASSGPVPPETNVQFESIATSNAPPLTGEPISVNFDGIRLPAFVNTVFGEMLKVTFEIDSGVAKKDQLVTLRTAEPLPPEKFLHLVEEVLGNYGISVVYSNGVYRIIESTSVKQSIPRIVRTRAIAQIPGDMRPVFYFQPLSNIATSTMTIWLQIALKDRVQAIAVPNFNGLLLLGTADDVNGALEIMRTLDQPYLAGARSIKIAPAFWSAGKLAQQLSDVLGAEGYSVAVGPSGAAAIKLVPIDALNIIIAFGTGDDTLQHVLKWAEELDQPGQTVATEGVYYYQVYNAKAKDIAEIVKGLLDQGSGAANGNAQKGPSGAGSSAGGGKVHIVVDEPRNSLIFMGSAEEYAQFRSLVSQMDRAPLEVMIEATIAEVTLSKDESLGVVLGYNDSATPAANNNTVTSNSSGLTYTILRSNGQINAQITALADRSRIQVLSSPRLVTSSGKAAAISVGSDVPIISAQETAPYAQVSGTSALLQSVQYRSTGIILNITPTINSNHRVELTVSQEVSNAIPNNTSSVSSPIISQRSIQTTLSLDDGQTVLLGGLISETYNNSDTGVPYLKDIPVLGNLFKSQSKSVQRQELIVLLTPYIIDTPDTAAQIRDSFRSQLTDFTGREQSQTAPATGPAPAAPSPTRSPTVQ